MIRTASVCALMFAAFGAVADLRAEDPTEMAREEIATMSVQDGDWPQWGGWSGKNNTPPGENIPTSWDVESEEDVLWSAPLGSQTYGNPVVAGGQAYVGTNNRHGYLDRYPSTVDLGCLVCFDAVTGDFLWQHSSEKLPTGRVHDWPDQGICCAPYVDGDRLWYVTSRGEVACLDTAGFKDGENDGPYTSEPNENPNEADVVWSYDMMGKNAVSQHNMCSCSVTAWGDTLLVNTSNGVDESHINIPSPTAPSFMAMNKNTGDVLWTDSTPGLNILHGQWSSPSYATLGGRDQALFAGGDGWLYSFDPKGDGEGNSKLLWKFDCNPKDSKWILGGRGTRNNLIGTPVIYDEMIYIAVGQDPEHGEGIGHLWCIDPTGEGDVSPTLAKSGDKTINPDPGNGDRRLELLNEAAGETVEDNPNSKMVWHYTAADRNGDGKVKFEEEMHRSCGTVCIKDDLLYLADFSGLFHCLDAKTGEPHYTYDMLTAAWGSAMIVGEHVYVGNEDGYVLVFELDAEASEPVEENDMGNSVYSTPIVAGNRLYIANKSTLFCIAKE